LGVAPPRAALADKPQRRRLLFEDTAGAAATAAFLAISPHGGCVVLMVTGANISDDVKRRAGVF